MSGGVTVLIVNEGRNDALITANTKLVERIKFIKKHRKEHNYTDINPTIADIESTHMIFMHASFKPYVKFAFEYQPKTPQSSTTTLGGQCVFSLPSYGDFIGDMVVHVRINPITMPNSVLPALPPNSMTGAGTTNTEVTTYRYINSNGETVAPGTIAKDFVRYVDKPGIRIFDKVEFSINSTPLDNYNYWAMIFEDKMFRRSNDYAWQKLIGQEIPIEAISNIRGSMTSGNIDNCRKLCHILNGPQTPKPTQETLDLWIPLLFWFCKDFRLALPSLSIPYGQRNVSIDFANKKNLLVKAYGDIKLEKTVAKYVLETNVGPILSGKTDIDYENIWCDPNSEIPEPTISNIVIYLNNLFLVPEIHDIFVQRIAFSLVRVFRDQTIHLNVSEGSHLLNNFKWPVEYVIAGIIPTTNANHPTLWHTFMYATENTIVSKSTSDAPVINTDITTGNPRYISTSVTERLTYLKKQKIFDSTQLKIQGNEIYKTLPSEFFNAYLPYRYGSIYLVSPKDDNGIFFITFCLYPTIYQPSGHINISRSREFYIEYTSSLIPGIVPNAQMHVLSSAINFLLVSEGTAVMRFTT